MHRMTRLTFCAALALTLAAGTRGYAQSDSLAQAKKASQAWLALVDAGKYGESWEAAAQDFKNAVSPGQWIMKVSAARGPLGKLISRKLVKSEPMKNPPKAPPGDYVGLQYQSSFEHLKSAFETVVPMRDRDGQWRVSGYIVRK